MSAEASTNSFKVNKIPPKKPDTQKKISQYFPKGSRGKSEKAPVRSAYKKGCQKKIKNYFCVTKPSTLELKNFQGFPLKDCIHSEELGKLIYWPVHYSGEYGKEPRCKLCTACLLSPCIAFNYHTEITNFAGNLRFGEGRNDFTDEDLEDMYCETIDYAATLLVGVFGPRYVRNTGVPECVHSYVGSYLKIVKNDLDDL
jgi:hypothetical protein